MEKEIAVSPGQASRSAGWPEGVPQWEHERKLTWVASKVWCAALRCALILLPQMSNLLVIHMPAWWARLPLACVVPMTSACWADYQLGLGMLAGYLREPMPYKRTPTPMIAFESYRSLRNGIWEMGPLDPSLS